MRLAAKAGDKFSCLQFQPLKQQRSCPRDCALERLFLSTPLHKFTNAFSGGQSRGGV
jgi:hypothetical protein